MWLSDKYSIILIWVVCIIISQFFLTSFWHTSQRVNGLFASFQFLLKQTNIWLQTQLWYNSYWFKINFCNIEHCVIVVVTGALYSDLPDHIKHNLEGLGLQVINLLTFKDQMWILWFQTLLKIGHLYIWVGTCQVVKAIYHGFGFQTNNWTLIMPSS